MNLPAAKVSLKDTALRGGVQNMEPPQAAGYCTPVHNKIPKVIRQVLIISQFIIESYIVLTQKHNKNGPYGPFLH
jgi:hypothetical protein